MNILASRRLFGHIKSLIHFDHPYYAGLDSLKASKGIPDEASNEHWSFHGRGTFEGGVHRTLPNDTTKFGWRSWVTYSDDDYAYCTNAYSTFKLNSQGDYEIECFIQPVDATAGNIIRFMTGSNTAFAISRDSSGKIKLVASAWNLNATGSAVIGTNSWHHLRVRISNNTATLYADGASSLTASLTANTAINVTECRVGGFNGYIDEFVYRDALDATPAVPSSAYKGRLDIAAMGGFGTGKHGALKVTSGQSIAINAQAQSLNEGETGNTKIKVSSWSNATLGTPSEGDELMFLIQSRTASSPDDLTGKFAFRYITSINGTNITLDRPLDDDFPLTEARQNYYVRIFHIPHFTSVTIDEGGKLLGRLLGLCAFRCAGNVNVKGSICPASTSLSPKVDNVLLTHSDLPDRFIPSSGGGVMIFCGGTLSCTTGVIGRSPQAHAKANKFGRGGNGSGQQGGIIMGGNASNGTVANWKNYGPCVLIAANTIAIEGDSMSTGGLHATSSTGTGQYSGLLYMAGNFAS